MSATVECHSGATYAERPLAFEWKGQRLEITEVIAEWRTPLGPYFRVRAPEGSLFELAYHEADDEWTIKVI